MTNLQKISDNELFIRCKKFGKEVLRARQIFGGLLPEVFKRRLYEKKGFGTIYEFAAKLAGLTHDQVDTYIRLARKYEDKPVLHSALVEGQISINKLVRIASIATTENQYELFELAKNHSKAAIDTYVKDYKYSQIGAERDTGAPADAYDCAARGPGGNMQIFAATTIKTANQNGIFPSEITPKTLPVQTLKLDEDVKKDLLEMQEKGIDMNGFLRKCLEQRKREIELQKERLAHEAAEDRAEKEVIGMPTSRHIPAKIRRVIAEEHGVRCSRTVGENRCNRRAVHIHHEKLFSKTHLHDPQFLKPLCSGHHELEHSGDQKYLRLRLSAATG
jgi:hypothetical protein